MNKNKSIELMRGIACILIVFVHCRFPETFGTYVVSIARFGVPFFLLISGYFSYHPNKADTVNHAKKKLRDTIMLTAKVSIFCIICNTIVSLLSGTGFTGWATQYINLQTLKNFLLYNRAVFLCSVMYYLFALIYTYVAFFVLVKCNILKHSYFLIPILLIGNLYFTEFTGANWYYAGNFLLTGIPFFLLGNLLGKTNLPQKFSGMWYVFAAFGFILTLLETYIFGEAYCYIGIILFSIAIFCICVNHPNSKLPNCLVAFGTKYSLLMFVFHCHVRDFLYLFIPTGNRLIGWIFPVFVVGTSTFIAYIFTRFTHSSTLK